MRPKLEANEQIMLDRLFTRLHSKMMHLSLEQISDLYYPDHPSAVYSLTVQASDWDEGELPAKIYARYIRNNPEIEID